MQDGETKERLEAACKICLNEPKCEFHSGVELLFIQMSAYCASPAKRIKAFVEFLTNGQRKQKKSKIEKRRQHSKWLSLENAYSHEQKGQP